VAYSDRTPAALQVLIDLTAHLSPSQLSWTLSVIVKDVDVASLSLNIAVIDLISSILSTSIERLYQCDGEESHSCLLSIIDQADGKLYEWADDISGLSDLLAGKCLSLLESQSIKYENKALLWARQESLIAKAVDALARKTSIIPSIRIIQGIISAWPKVATLPKSIDIERVSSISAPISSQSELIGYLEEKYGILHLLVNAIEYLQEQFSFKVSELDGSNGAASTAGAVGAATAGAVEELKATQICRSRYGYSEMIEKVFFFITFYVRGVSLPCFFTLR
jgi:hypothetical protein